MPFPDGQMAGLLPHLGHLDSAGAVIIHDRLHQVLMATKGSGGVLATCMMLAPAKMCTQLQTRGNEISAVSPWPPALGYQSWLIQGAQARCVPRAHLCLLRRGRMNTTQVLTL